MPDSTGEAIYRGMDRAALDAAYNNREAVADSDTFMQRWTAESAELRARAGARLDIPYGSRPRMKLDYFPCGRTKAPLFVFIHGGYWQRNDKDMFAFMAEGPRSRGIDVAIPGYTLAPEATMTDIVAEIRAALTFLAGSASDFGFDVARLAVGGWSAGGHLTAMMLDHPAVRGGLAISGIFDLEPIALTFLNDALSLTPEEIAECSPVNRLDPSLAPVTVAVGGSELHELVRQSGDYAARAGSAGMKAELRVLDGCHHYTVLDALLDRDGVLTQDLLRLLD